MRYPNIIPLLVVPLTFLVPEVALAQEGFPGQEFTRNVPVQEFQNLGDLPSYDLDAPPAGIFHEVSFAEDFDEDLGFRRAHKITPVNPTNVFYPDTSVIYLVFALHQHYDSFQLTGLCFPEQVDGLDPATVLAQDTVYLALEDESGYLQLAAPDGGWKPGTYKVEMHLGWEVNDISLIGTMRFTVAPDHNTIAETTPRPTAKSE